MSALVDYVLAHTTRCACSSLVCEHRVDESPSTTDMFFFDVAAKDNPDADEFKKLIQEHQGEFNDVNPFDGAEHNYIELGGWIGDQGIAMQFMGLGVLLNLWKVMHPVNMLKLERNNPLAQQLAGVGMVSLIANRG